MGQKPPPGLVNTVKGAPQNHGATRKSSLPERRTLIQRVKACKHSEAAGAVLPQTTSGRCWKYPLELIAKPPKQSMTV